jgi:phage gp16-like protein
MYAGLNKKTDTVEVVLTVDVDVRESNAAEKIADMWKLAAKHAPGSDADKNLEKWSKDPKGLLAHFHPRGED